MDRGPSCQAGLAESGSLSSCHVYKRIDGRPSDAWQYRSNRHGEHWQDAQLIKRPVDLRRRGEYRESAAFRDEYIIYAEVCAPGATHTERVPSVFDATIVLAEKY